MADAYSIVSNNIHLKCPLTMENFGSRIRGYQNAAWKIKMTEDHPSTSIWNQLPPFRGEAVTKPLRVNNTYPKLKLGEIAENTNHL
jgi:hypothetical protein